MHCLTKAPETEIFWRHETGAWNAKIAGFRVRGLEKISPSQWANHSLKIQKILRATLVLCKRDYQVLFRSLFVRHIGKIANKRDFPPASRAAAFQGLCPNMPKYFQPTLQSIMQLKKTPENPSFIMENTQNR